MMRPRLIYCHLIAAVALSSAFAEPIHSDAKQPSWKDEAGGPSPETEFRKSKDGFGGWLVVTPDNDWKEKWNTSPETVPHFETADIVERGKRLTVLIFFVGPAADAKNNVDVTCDIKSIRPDGGLSINEHDLPCLKGQLHGTPSNIRLAGPVIKFVGEPKDPAGKWMIEVTLKDNQRHLELPLKTSFTLK